MLLLPKKGKLPPGMVELFADIARLVEEGRPFVLATVVDASGSTPQKPGSKMVVLHGGERRGTVGGGAIEQQVVDAALALLADPGAQSKLIETHLTHDLGMCCGGKMRVFLEKTFVLFRGLKDALLKFAESQVAELNANFSRAAELIVLAGRNAPKLVETAGQKVADGLKAAGDTAKLASVWTHANTIVELCAKTLGGARVRKRQANKVLMRLFPRLRV